MSSLALSLAVPVSIEIEQVADLHRCYGVWPEYAAMAEKRIAEARAGLIGGGQQLTLGATAWKTSPPTGPLCREWT